MTLKAKEIANMIDMLPEQEQELAFSLIKRLVLAWDPDFTKITNAEAHELKVARNDVYSNATDINWDA